MSAATLETRPSGLLIPKVREVDRFPDIDPGVRPAGHRVLIQLKRTTDKVEGSSLYAADETRAVKQYKEKIGKVLATGPCAYRSRETGEVWFGGAWCKVGDYVRVPVHGGDRWSVVVDGDYCNPVPFVILNDDNVLGIQDDPLRQEGNIE